MRVLLVHNHYGKYATGGEANVMKAEAELLLANGYNVKRLEVTNADIYENSGIKKKITAFKDATWSNLGYGLAKESIRSFKPDIMHVHNYWALLSPSIFAAAKAEGIATVLTLHNYRLVCPGVLFLRNDKPCELCLDGKGWRVMLHRCYHEKNLLKAFMAYRLYRSTRKQNFLAAWIDAYIALTNFGREKFIKGGLPAKKIHVKSNFMYDPIPINSPISHSASDTKTRYAVFAGRVSPEKGVSTLMDAWHGVDYPLFVVGNGPELARAIHKAPDNVKFLYQKSHKDTLRIIKNSSFLVFPSEWYEGFPLILLEAMAMGKCVLASDLGSMPEIVEKEKTGLLFEAGNANHLREMANRLINNPKLCSDMGEAGRSRYLSEYTPEKNYEKLIQIYDEVLHLK